MRHLKVKKNRRFVSSAPLPLRFPFTFNHAMFQRTVPAGELSGRPLVRRARAGSGSGRPCLLHANNHQSCRPRCRHADLCVPVFPGGPLLRVWAHALGPTSGEDWLILSRYISRMARKPAHNEEWFSGRLIRSQRMTPAQTLLIDGLPICGITVLVTALSSHVT